MTGKYGGIDEPYDLTIPYPPGHPNDGRTFAMDAAITVYWPHVEKHWEERARGSTEQDQEA